MIECTKTNSFTSEYMIRSEVVRRSRMLYISFVSALYFLMLFVIIPTNCGSYSSITPSCSDLNYRYKRKLTGPVSKASKLILLKMKLKDFQNLIRYESTARRNSKNNIANKDILVDLNEIKLFDTELIGFEIFPIRHCIFM